MKAFAPLALVAGIVLTPFLAAWPVLQPNGMALAPGFDLWAARMLWATLFAVLGATILVRHPILGLAVGLGAVDVFVLSREAFGQSSIGIFALGVLGVVWVATWRTKHQSAALRAGGFAALVQSLVMLAQWRGYDVLWRGLAHDPEARVSGTFGNPGFAGAFCALAGLGAPGWALPIIGGGIAVAHARSAAIAFVAGVIVRYAPLPWVASVTLLVAAGVLAYGLAVTPDAQGRPLAWRDALRDVAARAPLLGTGLGLEPAPLALTADGGQDANAQPLARWFTLHSEYVAWLCARGLAGLALFLAAAWTYRRSVLHAAAGGAMTALIVLSLTWSPLHFVATGLVAVLLCGVAISPSPDPQGA